MPDVDPQAIYDALKNLDTEVAMNYVTTPFSRATTVFKDVVLPYGIAFTIIFGIFYAIFFRHFLCGWHQSSSFRHGS